MIGNKIKTLRNKYNITQEELASKLYVTRNSISKWENNKSFPNIDSLKEISKLFNVTLDYLISDEEIKELTIKNNKSLEETRNLTLSVVIFISLLLLSITVPELLLIYDPTGMIAVFLIIMPIIFIVFGIIVTFTKIKWPFLLISSALALIPIMIYFNHFSVLSSVDLYYLVYYILFNTVYIVMSIIFNKDISLDKSKELSKIFLIIFISVTSFFMLQTIIETILLYLNKANSAAYYTPFVVNLFIYIIPIIISLVCYLKFKTINTKKMYVVKNNYSIKK